MGWTSECRCSGPGASRFRGLRQHPAVRRVRNERKYTAATVMKIGSTVIAVAILVSSFAIDVAASERGKAALVCIGPFIAASHPNEAQLTNPHQPCAKSVFTFRFGSTVAVSVRSKERKILRLPPGEYRLRISLDGKPAESFRLLVRTAGVSLWYLDSSGWQVSAWPDKAHGCA